MPLPIGEPERHHRRAARVLEPPGEDRVVVRVGQHGEAVRHQLLGGREQLGRVGQQRAVVADHLELHPVGLERLAGELCGGHRLARREAARGVRQHLESRLLEHLHDRAAGARVHAPHRDRGQLGAGLARRLRHHLEVAKAAGAEDQARLERATG